jgi:hypothetical protein
MGHFRKTYDVSIRLMKRRGLRLAAVMALFVLLAVSLVGAAVPEYELKAAFVYNFAKFVEWPPQALSPASDTLILGVLVQDPESPAFEALQGKKVQGRTLVVKRCRLSELKEVHLVFISAGVSRYLGPALEEIRGLPILTITDEVEGSGPHGIINLVTTGGKVRFQVDAVQARRLGFRISSQLLRLALSVTE